jgi:hypothetical protein
MKSNRRARVADAKAKRQKITITAGSGILALVLAIQVPKMMSLLSPGGAEASAAPAQTTSTATTPATDPAQQPSGGSVPAATEPSGTASVASAPADDAAKTPTFDAFQSKDPFAPQLTTTQRAASDASDSSSSSGAATPDPNGGLVPAPSSAGTGDVTQPAPAAAVISVNGVPSTVTVGTTFPTSDPVFRLVKLGTTVAKIAIAEGSYTNGAKTISLTLHSSLTLLNTATGARYRLQFVSVAP